VSVQKEETQCGTVRKGFKCVLSYSNCRQNFIRFESLPLKFHNGDPEADAARKTVKSGVSNPHYSANL
jgi:hypothetical protein